MTDISSYEQTIRDLELRIAKSQDELNKMQDALAVLRAIVANGRPWEKLSISNPDDDEAPNLRFRNMSVRWAVLKCLASANCPLKTSEISLELERGGNDHATRSNVSAVISDMVNKRNEVRMDDNGYTLTDTGRTVWNAITHSLRYLNRHLSPIES